MFPRTQHRRLLLILAAFLLLARPLPSAAGGGGPDRTRYFPLDHPAYDYLDRLQQAGKLLSLNPSLRPYTRGEVLAAVGREKLRNPSPLELGWLNWLAVDCEREYKTLAAADSGNLGVTTRLEAGGRLRTLEPERERSRLGVGFGGALGRVVFDSRFLRAPYLMRASDQADHRDPKVVPPDEDGLIRPMEGYLKADFPMFEGRYSAELFFGRMARNWSPQGMESLVLNGRALSFDQLALRIRSPHLTLSQIVAALDPVDYHPAGSTELVRARRFFSAHRLGIRVRDNLRFGITETTIYGGPGRGWEPGLMNPLTSYRLLAIQDDERWSNNSFVALDGFAGLGGKINIRAQMLFDDFLRDKKIQNRWALSLGLDFCRLPLPGTNSARLEYSRASSYAYNTFRPWERYLISGRPLGAQQGNDFYRLAAELTQYFDPSFDITAGLAYSGQGSLRISSPVAGLLDSASLPFPAEPVEETLELMLSLRWQPADWCILAASGGYSERSGVDNIAGQRLRRGYATVELSLFRDIILSF
ncbi:MAG: capsule assembly Wzi family protein [Candidatus Glassbacteria bacterium]|nr:capsule assembly Wzi family protein [Candidatus Glassbacteria bacterium]